MPHRYDSSLTITESLDSWLKALVERAAKGVGAAYACLLLRAQETSELHIATWYGWEEASESCSAIAQQVFSKGEPLYLPKNADAKQMVGSNLGKDVLPIICAPVMSGAALEGVLAVGSPHSAGEKFRRWLPLIESLAELAGALLEITALRRDLARKEEQIRDLVRDTLDAQEAEREHIRLEVHDGVTQTLASVFQHLQTLELTLSEGTPARQLLLRVRGLIEQAIQECREVINSLQPATLTDLGLIATLRQEMRQLEQETGWEVDFKVDVTRLPKDIETGLYRIIHEAINNARKHANTNRLQVIITAADDRLKVEVRDWGIGFNYNPQAISRRRGTGLLSMRKRAELLQGVCDIQSTPHQGTVVRIEIPLST